MPLKASGTATDPLVTNRWEGGVSWIAHPEEWIARASHALAAGDGAWVVEPVDFEGLDDLLAEVGTVAGVVVLLGRHRRDAAAVARRHGVPVYLPADVPGVELDAPVERFEGELADTGYAARTVVDWPLWRERGLSDGETLVVSDALGTADHYRTRDERLAVHPALRFTPPRRALSGIDPDRILVGHGADVTEDAAGALRGALSKPWRRAPALYLGNLRAMLPYPR